MNILILGQHGSGKSTQAQLLAEHYGLPMIAMGDIFRKLSKEQTEEGLLIKDCMERGEYVPEELSFRVLERFLFSADMRGGFVLEGYPRTLAQAELLIQTFDHVFYLVLSDEDSRNRMLKRGRPDDNDATMEKRMTLHNRESGRVIEFYRQLGWLEEIDAQGSIEEILQKLVYHIDHINHDRH